MSTVTTKRSLYREVCKSSRQIVKDTFTCGGSLRIPAPGSLVAPLSNDIKIHYSFDMAQQVYTLSMNYFTTHHSNYRCTILAIHFSLALSTFFNPRKCAVFGVSCEAIPRQVGSSSKYPRTVINCIIHFPIDHIPGR